MTAIINVTNVTIVGAGHGGGAFAAALRSGGYAGEIVLIGDEPHIPYQRPPLSKDYLKDAAGFQQLQLKPEQYYHDQNVATHLGTRVESIDPAAKKVVLAGGIALNYGVLVLATGSRPRRIPLPGIDLKGVHELRTIADADALKPIMQDGKRIALIGGGYIGLEVAASAVGLGGAAVVVEREARVLARVASEPLSRFLQDFHRAKGVEILVDCQVSGLEGDADGFVKAVILSDGSKVPCDGALLCVGGVPNDELAKAAGLVCDGGIVVDLAGRTSDPSIFALGDVARRPLPLYDDQMFRLESVPNALEQGKQIAAELLGKPAPAAEVQWFWSNQFDLKIQIAGLPLGADRRIVRGNPDEGKFSVCHLAGNRLLCVEAVNAPADFLGAKALIGQKSTMDPDKLADAATALKAALAAA
jgi:3-phenylpropionate/trans-cinnamate dioxygenase ferredoxin reductase component